MAKPEPPLFYPKGKWNRKIYNTKDANYKAVYIDNERQIITAEQAESIEAYLVKLAEYKEVIEKIKNRMISSAADSDQRKISRIRL